MMDPRNEQEEEVKKYYSVPVHNFVRRFKLINATFRKEAGSTDVLIDVTRGDGYGLLALSVSEQKISTALITKKRRKKREKKEREKGKYRCFDRSLHSRKRV